MDDLIRRQDAIDLLNEQVNQCDKALRYLSIVHSEIDEYAVKVERASLIVYKEQLESIPPAQPEIIRCKDCKYAEIADKYDNQDGYTCQFHRGSIWFSGSYCSWGERKTNFYG